MKPLKRDVWLSAADDVCAVLATDSSNQGDGYYERAVYEQELAVDHFPAGKHRAFFCAVADLRRENRPITYNNVAALAGEEVSLQWFYELVALADGGTDTTIKGRAFDSNVALLRDYGLTTGIIEDLQSAAMTLQNGGDRDAEIDLLISTLAMTGMVKTRDTSASAAALRFQAYMSQSPEPVVSTGIDWLDDDTNGLMDSKLWYLAGPYKSSKTRLAYNMALATAEQGIPTAILSRENQEGDIVAQFVCMLAVRWLRERVPYDPEQSVWWISPASLKMARNTYKNWQPKIKAQAVDAGWKAFYALEKNLHIFDSTPEGGRLSDIKSIRRVIQRTKRLFGVRKLFLDHLGLVKRDGTIYEKTSANSNELQELSREDSQHPITLVVLAQLNEDTIKNGEGYQAGVKGGGDPSADADVLLTTRPVEISTGVYYDDRTSLKVKFNRWGSSGARHEVLFHPESGLVLPSRTIDLNSLTGEVV